MKRFRFTLEKVLKVREHETTLAEEALAEALGSASRAQEAAEDATQQRLGHQTEWKRQAADRHTVRQWILFQEIDEAFRLAEQQAHERWEEALGAVGQQREILQAATQREKALETLREHQWEAYRSEWLACEQAELDEIGQTISLNQRRGDLREC